MLVGINPVSVAPIDCSSVIEASVRHQLLTASINDWAATDAVFALMVMVAGSSLRMDRMVVCAAATLPLQAATAAVGDCQGDCKVTGGRTMVLAAVSGLDGAEEAGPSEDII